MTKEEAIQAERQRLLEGLEGLETFTDYIDDTHNKRWAKEGRKEALDQVKELINKQQ